MRRIAHVVVLALLLAAVFSSQPASASADLNYVSFSADITVNSDASIDVRETIIVDFLVEKHGIFRNIPYRFKTPDGGSASIPIEGVSVTMDGGTVPASITKNSNEVVAKIGDPDKTIIGQHTYVISYRALAAVNFFTDHDELYWNATGDQWDQPLTSVTATVHAPAGFETGTLRTACYTGESGSTATDCTMRQQGNDAVYTATTFLTIVTGWQPGLVTKPDNYDSLRAKAGSAEWPWWIAGWMLALNVLIPLGTFVGMRRHWAQKGDDPDEKRTVIAQYDPPDDLRPAEVGVLVNQQANVSCITATIVDLAVRGFIRIEEVEKPSFLGLSHKRDYVLVDLKKERSALRAYEEGLLAALFTNPKVPASGDRIALSEFVKKKQSVLPFKEVTKDMTSDMAERGYFTGDPAKVRAKYLIIAGIMMFIGFGFGAFIVPGIAVAGLIVGIFGWFMPQKTKKGVEAAWVAKGFKEYLKTAEKYRLQWQERAHIFEMFLPYAMIFGVAKHWSEVLAPVVKEAPDWYVGSQGTAFNSLVFYHSISSMGSMVSTSAVSGAAAGSSGFSGGSSGGGGGGGGGGGW